MSTSENRIKSIDLIKGAVILLMALDHVRDYFHADAFNFDPTDLDHTNAAVFITRIVTHFCAPAFSLLAGTSVYLVGRRKPKAELTKFLLLRGAWLVLVEATIITFGWFFDYQFKTIELQVIWSLGLSMICLAALIHLPVKYILTISLILILGHNLLDHVHFDNRLLWKFLHEPYEWRLAPHFRIEIFYPLIPWVGVMAIGYCLGIWYTENPTTRRRKLIGTGLALLILFIIIRLTNVYGDPIPWELQNTGMKTLLAFFKLTKYPPSLLFLFFTLGIVLIALGLIDNINAAKANFLSVFGRIPFFSYVIHIYLLHTLAKTAAWLTGFGWQSSFWAGFINFEPQIKGYGFSLPIVYAIWICVIVFMYPFCRWFDSYKTRNKQKAWLSYL